ncbi:2-C-methyl-D-erythritol 4-phosphate cytidylyltransferase [soil metagenome]
MGNTIIIVAGGSGSRMNAEIPKQFISIAGKPILMHTIEKFHAADPSMLIIVVLPETEIREWKSLCLKYNFSISHEINKGGQTRFHSVKNGLALVKENGIVGIHDGVRPLVSKSLIRSCFAEAEEKGNAVPCVGLRESIRAVQEGRNAVADREGFVSIQTPQCFSADVLKQAYQAEYNSFFTDDATVVETTGEKINLVEGEHENIKITFPGDLLVAETFLKSQK